MRAFIGNPFQQELEDDELDEFEFEDVLRIVEADRLMGPPEDVEEEEEDNDLILIPDTEDDDDPDLDPDYIFENNDVYDSDDSREFEDLPNYELRGFSTDEDEDLDYVTFPVSENNSIETITTQPIETTNKTTNQDSLNSPSSDPEFAAEEDEGWD